MTHPNLTCSCRAGTALIVAALAALTPRAEAQTSVTHTFVPNTTARAAEVNENFADLAVAIDRKATGVEYNNVYDAGCSPSSYDFCSGWLTTAFTDMGAISVTTPGAGTILLFMSGEVLINDDQGLCQVGIGTTASAFAREITIGRARADLNNNLITYESFTLIHPVSVSAAGTYTYHALAKKHDALGGTAGVSVGGVKLVAVFVPTHM